MNLKDHCLNMVVYSRWATQRLALAMAQLPDDKYRADRKLAFNSIHGTLNHILLVERIWLHRCKSLYYEHETLADEQAKDRAAVLLGLKAVYDEWEEFIRATPTFDLGNTREYETSDGKYVSLALGSMVLHACNHATHHRGQISAALTQYNLPAPEMELSAFLLE
jgi:uncharacterized damage-inducible protein DinB